MITVSREINLEEAVRIKDLGQLGTLIIVSTRTKNQCKTWGRPGIGTFLLCMLCNEQKLKQEMITTCSHALIYTSIMGYSVSCSVSCNVSCSDTETESESR